MLFKKMLRDISDYKLQFISIFLLAFLGVFLFSGINAEEMGLESSKRFYQVATFSPSNLISTCIIIFAVSIIVIIIFFYKIKKLDMVEESKFLSN